MYKAIIKNDELFSDSEEDCIDWLRSQCLQAIYHKAEWNGGEVLKGEMVDGVFKIDKFCYILDRRYIATDYRLSIFHELTKSIDGFGKDGGDEQ